MDDDKFIKLNDAFKQYAQPIGGIGTFFTNDVGVKSLNMVIKMTKANFGQGMVNVVKLSDDKGKHTGNSDAIRRAKEEISVA